MSPLVSITFFLVVVTISTADDKQPPPLFTFDNGKIGVNFLGFRASAGLDGGPHAEAGTPWGQAAGAGVGGAVDNNGRAAGGLYAGATAGGNIGARAGLGGQTGPEGAIGGTYAGASAGGVAHHVAKVAAQRPLTFKEQSEVENLNTVVPNTVIVEKTKIKRRRPFHSRVKIYNNLESVPVAKPAGTATVDTTVNPEFFNNIFNIPISTLEAVNRLLNGILEARGGSTVAVTKTKY